MVAVAQLVESRIVIPVVVGSSPISHPIFSEIDASLGPRLFSSWSPFFHEQFDSRKVGIGAFFSRLLLFKGRMRALGELEKPDSLLDVGLVCVLMPDNCCQTHLLLGPPLGGLPVKESDASKRSIPRNGSSFL
jgi:hypothetical protein